MRLGVGLLVIVGGAKDAATADAGLAERVPGVLSATTLRNLARGSDNLLGAPASDNNTAGDALLLPLNRLLNDPD